MQHPWRTGMHIYHPESCETRGHATPAGAVLHAPADRGRAGDVREHAVAGAVEPGHGDADPQHQRAGGHDGIPVRLLCPWEPKKQTLTFACRQVLVPQVRDGQLPACGADHVPRAHAGGVPGGRGDDHAAHVGAGAQQAADGRVSGQGGAGVRARLAGLRARERERHHAERGGAGPGAPHGGQPALDP